MSTRLTNVTFLGAVGPYRNRFLLVLLLLLLDTVFASIGVGLVLPVFQALLSPTHENVLLSRLLPHVDEYAPETRLILLASITILVFFFKALFATLTAIISNDFLQKLRFYWIAQIGDNYLKSALLKIAGHKQGELLNDWFSETLTATRFFKSLLNYLSSTTFAVGLVILGLLVNWRAMISMLAIGIIAAMLIRTLTYKRSAILSREKLKYNQALNSSMVEDLASLRDLKLMSAEQRRLDILAELSGKLKSIFVQGAILGEIPKISGEFLAIFFLMGIILINIVALDMAPQEVLPMMAFFFITFYRLVTASSISMTSRVRALNDVQSVKRIQELLGQNHSKEILDAGLPIDKIDTDICLRNVSFNYGRDTRDFNAVDVVIPKGQVTLLVGPSGSGKSTMLDLLVRLIEPIKGEITANGKIIAEFKLEDWRNCFGYVSQDAALFNGSIINNFLLAKPDSTTEEILKACRLVGAENFINDLPDGLDTLIGDKGYSLSGGQRKRIAIARALIREPSVLILDEATSSFEQKLEQNLLTELKNSLPDLTIVQVTHRVLGSSNVDWIIVIDEGNVVACESKDKINLVDYGI